MIESTHRYAHGRKSNGIDRHQAQDAGLALTLIILLLAYFGDNQYLVALGIALLVVCMSLPVVFKPFARIWFGFAHILGAFMSRLVLGLIFFLMVTPMGLVRRLLGKDSLKLKGWKQGNGSVFEVRDLTYSKEHIEKPY